MRDPFFEVPYLLLQLGIIRFKTLILQLKISYLLFEQCILIIRQRNALAQYRSRAVLVNKLFDAVEKSHVDTPNYKFDFKTAV